MKSVLSWSALASLAAACCCSRKIQMIRKANTYEDIRRPISEKIDPLVKEKMDILKKHPSNISTDPYDFSGGNPFDPGIGRPFFEFRKKLIEGGHLSPAQKTILDNARIEEQKWLDKFPNGISRVQAEERKQYLAKLTKTLQEKRRKFGLNELEDLKLRSLDKFREGYEDVISSGPAGSFIEGINKPLEGLITADDLLATREAERLISSVTQPSMMRSGIRLGRDAAFGDKVGMASEAINMIPEKGWLEKTTGEIEKNVSRAGKLKELVGKRSARSRKIGDILNKRIF